MEAILLLGSNLGNKEENLAQALDILSKAGIEFIKKTDISHTEPVEFASNNNFCNIAALINTDNSPIELLNTAKSIEKSMGRERDSQQSGGYEDRIIDIDIVSFGNMTFISKKLYLPHRKHLFERDFSQVLLQDLANKTQAI